MVLRAELHELACTDATTGCVCKRLTPHISVIAKPLVPDWQVSEYARSTGIDTYLSSLESVLIALEQRQLDHDQLDRFARLLQQGERMALTRARLRRP